MKAKLRKTINRDLIRDLKTGALAVQAGETIHDTEMKGFCIRARPEERGFYVIKRVGGRVIFKKIGDCALMPVSEAREKARQILARMDLGELPTPVIARRPENTLEAFIQGSYGDYLRTKQKNPDTTIKNMLAAFAELRPMRLDKIDALLVDYWQAGRVKAGIKPATINRYMSDLRALLTYAVGQGVLDKHPLRVVKRLQEPGEHRIRYLSPDEEHTLRAALDAREEAKIAARARGNAWRIARNKDTRDSLQLVAYIDHLKPAVLVAMNTGLRQGELFQLEWRDVDLERGLITVRAATAKSLKTRHVPLNAEALEVLRGWHYQGDGLGPVFPGENGGPLTEVKTSWRRLLKDAGIQNFRWHDLRHHFASRLVMAGVDLNTVRELLGHADIKMTLRYAYLAPEHKRAAVELISGAAGGPVRGKVVRMNRKVSTR